MWIYKNYQSRMIVADITIPYGFTPRPYQLNILNALDSGCLNACWIVHRRGGKDTTMWNYMIKRAYMEPGTYYYFLPTFAQAKRVIWDGMTNDGKRMLDYIPKSIIDGNPNNTEMKIWINGAKGQSLIQLIGSDSFDAIMGTNPRGIVFSEWSLMDPMVYDFVKPILAANGGWCAFLYTPRGKNHGWDLAEIAKRHPKDWFFEILTVRETKILTEVQIETERRKGMPEDMIQQEFYCFPGDVSVLTADGAKNIESIDVGDLVLTHTGRFRSVLTKFSRFYEGNLVTISSYGNNQPIICTPNHPIRIFSPSTQSYNWVAAEDIDVGDNVVYPKMMLRDVKIITENLALLMAWYICEGSISKGAVQFTVRSNSDEIERVQSLAALCGYEAKVYVNLTATNVTVCDGRLCDFFVKHCGSGSKNKKIPLEMIAGNENVFFHELMKRDGCFTCDKSVLRYYYITTSESLAYQVQLLGNSIGYRCGISKQVQNDSFIEGRKIVGGVCYQIGCYVKESNISRLSSGKDCVYGKVREISSKPFSGTVYNMEVQFDNSYVANGRSVHNCNFSRGQEGSYFGKQMEKLRKDERICKVQYDPAVPVRTFWDLGIGDSTAIWFAQFVGKEIHLINYYENSGEGLPHYARVLDDFRRETECVYDLNVAPHDIQARELTTGKTRLETARRLGLNFRVAPKLSLESGIEAVRMILSKCWFDENRCSHGIKCLENYRKQYNEKYKVYSDTPHHDYSSHGADAFRMLAITESSYRPDKGVDDVDYEHMKGLWGWKI